MAAALAASRRPRGPVERAARPHPRPQLACDPADLERIGAALTAWAGPEDVALDPDRLRDLSARVAALAAALGLGPGRLEAFAPAGHTGEWRARVAHLGATDLVGAPARLRWLALDRAGRPVLLAELVPDDSPSGPAPSSARARGSFRLVPALPALLEALLIQGAWPAWLAPEPVRVLPVPGDLPGAAALRDALRAAGLAAGLDSDGPLAHRVGRAHAARVPWLAVVGRRELARGEVTLRCAGASEQETVPLAAAVARLLAAAAPPTSFLSGSRTGDGRRPAPDSRPTGGNCHSAP